jgi:hypothetical protein
LRLRKKLSGWDFEAGREWSKTFPFIDNWNGRRLSMQSY